MVDRKRQLELDKCAWLQQKDHIYQRTQVVADHEAEIKCLLERTRMCDDHVQIIRQELAEIKMRKTQLYANIYEAKAEAANHLNEDQ